MFPDVEVCAPDPRPPVKLTRSEQVEKELVRFLWSQGDAKSNLHNDPPPPAVGLGRAWRAPLPANPASARQRAPFIPREESPFV